ncbi:hypothetical protein PENPOL_c014G07413 [Penicillium polonicum]|uniref:Uncharacterized protein n=1 Tax=Penicillium polonicum TaxID=60169 RepID=A0A1V6NB74_PENPO|nr:hypothetical protein PENPOL_c014G07413 [Penicillium polonicum]
MYIDSIIRRPTALLDSQDHILFKYSNTQWANLTADPRPPVRDPSAEQDREVHTCMVRDVWGDRIDGVTGTEGACGVVLYGFERGLEVRSMDYCADGGSGCW